MDGEGAYSDDVGHLQSTAQRIEQQSGANTAPLPFPVHGKTSQNKKRDGMAWQSLGDTVRRVGMADLASDNGVVADYRLSALADIGL